MGLFENAFANPETMGLLAAAAQGLQMSGPSRVPVSTGQVLGAMLGGGMQGYQGALKAQQDGEERNAQIAFRNAQMDQVRQKANAALAQQTAIANLKKRMADDPLYRPTAADMLDIDAESAIKGMMPGQVDFGLEPKIGINPTTGKPGYFVQDKRSGTKWLDAGVPDSFKLIPGTDYQAPQTFNPRSGDVAPVRPFAPQSSGTAPASPMAAAPGMPAAVPASAEVAPTVDSLAPWANLRSPKEQEQMRTRVYEQDNKRLDELRSQIARGRTIMRDLERFGELNRKQETGQLIDQFGALPTFDPEKKEMDAITARLAPAQREEGSGASSNLDVTMFLRGLPSTDKEGPVNQAIRKQFAEQLKNFEQQFAFKERYLAEKGHLAGADEAHQQAIANSKSGGLDMSQLPPEVAEYLRQQNPEAFERGVARFEKNSATPTAQNADSQQAAPVKAWKDFGYADQKAAVRDAQNAIMRNPSAKAEIIRRLEASGITNHGLK